MKLYSLGEVARLAGVAPFRISYAIGVGALPDTAMRFANKRCFTEEDVDRVVRHFRPESRVERTARRKEDGEV